MIAAMGADRTVNAARPALRGTELSPEIWGRVASARRTDAAKSVMASGHPTNNGPCPPSPYNAVRRRTKEAFGFVVNLPRFRLAAGTFWSIRDPRNVRGVKDLLGHATFGITERFYILGQSRLAGRVLAHAVDAAPK